MRLPKHPPPASFTVMRGAVDLCLKGRDLKRKAKLWLKSEYDYLKLTNEYNYFWTFTIINSHYAIWEQE